MKESMEDNITGEVLVAEKPIKGSNEAGVAFADIQAQAELGRQNEVTVDYAAVYGTCSDERERIGTLDGSSMVEPRPSVLGGPNVYGLGIAELTGMFSEDNENNEDSADSQSRLGAITQKINDAKIKSGGHVGCTASVALPQWLRAIGDNPEAFEPFVSQGLGDVYDETALPEIAGFARQAVASGRYDDWSEQSLITVLGDEAGEAIERLATVPHEGFLFQRTTRHGVTIDQTTVYQKSVVGPGSFIFDDGYADAIEAAVTAGPNVARKSVLARHAREAIIGAVANLVPNETLFLAQDN